MQTIIEQISFDSPRENLAAIKAAAKIILSGGLVAFPTETVYGLGANAFDSEAVKKIFIAKGRPQDNPLIVHISSLAELERVAVDIPPLAYKLADAFWPGALTMIFKKASIIPYETTAGLDTVAVRLPAHKTAALLLETAGVPIAAPSANISGKPSSTLASHVEADLHGKIDMILDSGSVDIGIESTVADLSVFPPCVLRPGSVTLDMLKKFEPLFEKAAATVSENSPKSPGMKYTHYSPAAKLVIVSGKDDDVINKINKLAAENSLAKKIGILTCGENTHRYNSESAHIISVGERSNMVAVAQNLFNSLRTFDLSGTEIIYAEAFPDDGIGSSVMDRLIKASGYTVLKV